MKKIFCIFIMFCICIVNAWADVANPCPPDTLEKIGIWTSTCANQTDDAAKKLKKCIKYFSEHCGELNAANAETPVQYVAEADCKEFEEKNFKGIEKYLDDQVKKNCTPQAGECPYKADIAGWKEKCKDNNKLLLQINAFETACGQHPNPKTVINPGENETIESRKEKLEQLVNAQCVAAPEDKNKKVLVTVDYTKITGYGSTLDGIIGNLDLSVWKNADGKFNTARLASDSIAGVVLGTAGGLITSSVMKKHQAADGFEDLKCVVGGQSVAGWGDVFNVGIQ